MPLDNTITQGADATTGNAGGAPAQTAGLGNQGTSPEPAWHADEKFRGKDANHVYNSYKELEKKLGRLPDLERQLGEWQTFGQRWDPYLRQFGYQPEQLAQKLEAQARRAEARGDQAGAQQAHAAAKRAWAEALTPDQQEQWITEHVNGRFNELGTRHTQSLQQLASQGQAYMQNLVDLALRAVELKFQNPKLSFNELLKGAAELVNNPYDPLEMAARMRSMPSMDDLRAQIREEERKALRSESENAQLTTMVGAGGSRGRQAMRPAARPNSAPRQPAGTRPSLEDARAKFIQNFSNIATAAE